MTQLNHFNQIKLYRFNENTRTKNLRQESSQNNLRSIFSPHRKFPNKTLLSLQNHRILYYRNLILLIFKESFQVRDLLTYQLKNQTIHTLIISFSQKGGGKNFTVLINLQGFILQKAQILIFRSETLSNIAEYTIPFIQEYANLYFISQKKGQWVQISLGSVKLYFRNQINICLIHKFASGTNEKKLIGTL